MTTAFPFLTTYDPLGTSEGTLDPLGLYQIADQLAVQLVPAVRERMQRVRFLTAVAVGSLIVEGLDDDPRHRDASPYLVWEWLVVEAIVRRFVTEGDLAGVAGRHMARRAIDKFGYLDARSYLKTPRIFGIHGVYKRLAVHLRLLDVHLGPGPNAERLVDAWARDIDAAGGDAKALIAKWKSGVRRCLEQGTPQTKTNWSKGSWDELADAFAPGAARANEKRFLRRLLLGAEGQSVGAFPAIWELQAGYDPKTFEEESLHRELAEVEPSYGPLLHAIRAYESFARSLQDAFDVLKAEAAKSEAQGYVVPKIADSRDFKKCTANVQRQFEAAHDALGAAAIVNRVSQGLFAERFKVFSEPMPPSACALALCEHHVKIQEGKSATGKRAWFDRLGPDRIYIRHAYREERRDIAPGVYVHEYRGRPIGRFRKDLS
ncbi:MAG: hypothetical protein AB7N29_14750 [Vicinamibacterales bacterium]